MPILHRCKGAAPELWGFHMDGQQGKRFLQDGIDHRLVVGDAVVDDIVDAVIVPDVHAVEIIVAVIGDFFNAVHRAQPPGIQHAKPGCRQQYQQQKRQQNTQNHLFHRKRLPFICILYNLIIAHPVARRNGEFITVFTAFHRVFTL